MQRGFAQSFGRACRTQFNSRVKAQSQSRFSTQAEAGIMGSRTTTTTTTATSTSRTTTTSRTTQTSRSQSQQQQQQTTTTSNNKTTGGRQQKQDKVTSNGAKAGANQASRTAMAFVSKYGSLASLGFTAGEGLLLSGLLDNDDG